MIEQFTLAEPRQKMLWNGVLFGILSAAAAWLTSYLGRSLLFRLTLSRLSDGVASWVHRSVLLDVLGSGFGTVALGVFGALLVVLLAKRFHLMRLQALLLLPVSAVLTMTLMGLSFRLTALVVAPIALAVQFVFALTRISWRWLIGTWGLVLVLSFLPIDVTTLNVPGGPRFVPLAMGLPGKELMSAAERGDVVLGGCVVSGFEPRWVLVW